MMCLLLYPWVVGGRGGQFKVVTKGDGRGNTKAHMEEEGHKRLCIRWLSLAKLLHRHKVVLTLQQACKWVRYPCMFILNT